MNPSKNVSPSGKWDVVYGGTDLNDLYVYQLKIGPNVFFVSRWTPNDEERRKIAEGGDVYLYCMDFQPPVFLSSDAPEIDEETGEAIGHPLPTVENTRLRDLFEEVGFDSLFNALNEIRDNLRPRDFYESAFVDLMSQEPPGEEDLFVIDLSCIDIVDGAPCCVTFDGEPLDFFYVSSSDLLAMRVKIHEDTNKNQLAAMIFNKMNPW